MRAGDFSAFGTTIYDPATGNADGTGRTPFANNIIPANRISSIAQALQSRLPLPNGPGTSSNYTDTGTVDFNRNNYDVKLNYNISSAAQIFAKYSQMNATVYSDMWLGNPPDGGAGRLRLRRRLGHGRHQGQDRHPRPHLDALAEAHRRRRPSA